MYFWKAEKLQEELKASSVTEKEKAIYYVLTSCFIVFAMWAVDMDKESVEIIDHVNYVLMILALALGTLYAFKKYVCEDKFLERFICLSFPLVNQLLTYSVLLSIPFEVMVAMDVMAESFPYFLIISNLMNFWFYRRLGNLMGKF